MIRNIFTRQPSQLRPLVAIGTGAATAIFGLQIWNKSHADEQIKEGGVHTKNKDLPIDQKKEIPIDGKKKEMPIDEKKGMSKDGKKETPQEKEMPMDKKKEIPKDGKKQEIPVVEKTKEMPMDKKKEMPDRKKETPMDGKMKEMPKDEKKEKQEEGKEIPKDGKKKEMPMDEKMKEMSGRKIEIPIEEMKKEQKETHMDRKKETSMDGKMKEMPMDKKKEMADRKKETPMDEKKKETPKTMEMPEGKKNEKPKDEKKEMPMEKKETQGDEKMKDDLKEGTSLKTKLGALVSDIIQPYAPVRAINSCMNDFIFESDSKKQFETHCLCTFLNDDVAQCSLYDTNDSNARLIGIEYTVSDRIFKNLPKEEQSLWTSNAFEVKTGLMIAPRLPALAEHALMHDVARTYSKTFITWHIDKDNLPLGTPQLAFKFTADGPRLDGALLNKRNRRYDTDSNQLTAARDDIEVPKMISSNNSWRSGEAPSLMLRKKADSDKK